jgi:hypothetical protein
VGQTAATATVIASLPTTIVEDIAGLAGDQQVWYTYTTNGTECAFGVYIWSEPTWDYRKEIVIYSGTPEDLTTVFTVSPTVGTLQDNFPICVPVVGVTTYYVRVRNTTFVQPDPDAPPLTVMFTPAPVESVPLGSLLIPDDSEGHPLVALDATDGHVRRVVHPFPHGETGATSPVTGRILVRSDDLTRIALYDSDVSLVTEISGFHASVESDWFPQFCCSEAGTFYVVDEDVSGTGALWLWVIADDGTVISTTDFPLTAYVALGGIGVSPDETILYYVQSNGVFRYDLATGTSLGLFVANAGGYNPLMNGDFAVYADGSFLLSCKKTIGGAAYAVKRYGADGTLLTAYVMTDDPAEWYIHHIARGVTDSTFWVWQQAIGVFGYYNGYDKFTEFNISDGSVARALPTVVAFSEGIAIIAGDVDAPRFAHSKSCPLLIARVAIASASPSSSRSASASVSPSASSSPSPSPSMAEEQTYLIRRLRQAPHLSDEHRWQFHQRFQLDLETGVGLSSGQGSDPQIMLCWSDDHGHTWSHEHWTSAGKIGEFKRRALWYRLGRTRDRIYRVVVSDPVKWALVDAYLQLESGRR